MTRESRKNCEILYRFLFYTLKSIESYRNIISLSLFLLLNNRLNQTISSGPITQILFHSFLNTLGCKNGSLCIVYAREYFVTA